MIHSPGLWESIPQSSFVPTTRSDASFSFSSPNPLSSSFSTAPTSVSPISGNMDAADPLDTTSQGSVVVRVSERLPEDLSSPKLPAPPRHPRILLNNVPCRVLTYRNHPTDEDSFSASKDIADPLRPVPSILETRDDEMQLLSAPELSVSVSEALNDSDSEGMDSESKHADASVDDLNAQSSSVRDGPADAHHLLAPSNQAGLWGSEAVSDGNPYSSGVEATGMDISDEDEGEFSYLLDTSIAEGTLHGDVSAEN